MNYKPGCLVFILLLNLLAETPKDITSVFPEVLNLETISFDGTVYFAQIDFDISTASMNIQIDQITRDAKQTYTYIMHYKPDPDDGEEYDSITIAKKRSYRKLPRRKVIDSIIVPELMKMEIQSILFDEFSDRPYFDTVFKDPVCLPDSLAKRNWNQMEKKLEIFKDSLMLANFDKVTNENPGSRFLIPAGLLLLKNGLHYNWYIPIGWEFRNIGEYLQQNQKNDEAEQCYKMSHILGFIYSFDFSEKLYEFECK